MSVIIRLQNLPLTASSLDIRNFFNGLSIPDGGVHIVGGPEGDAFIAFSTDEDARQAMRLTGQLLKDSKVSLLLSSRNEMYKIIEQARLAAMGGGGGGGSSQQSSSISSSVSANNMHGSHLHHQQQHNINEESSPPPSSHHHLSSQPPPSNHLGHSHSYGHSSAAPISNSMSPPSSASNDFLKGFGGTNQGGPQADLSSNPALLFSTMSAIPSTTLGGAGSSAGTFLTQQQQQQQQHGQYPGLGSSANSHQLGGVGASSHQLGGVGASSHQQNQAPSMPGNLPFGVPNNPNAAAMGNGANPFIHFPPPSTLSGLPPLSSMLQGQGMTGANNTVAANPLSLPQTGGLGMASTTVTGMGGMLPRNHNINMNTTMSMAGQATSALNPFGTAPSRMNMMNNGLGGPPPNGPHINPQSSFTGGPRLNNNFSVGIQNQYGVGVGAGTGGPRQPGLHGHGPRTPYGIHAATMNNNSGSPNNGEMKNRFQFGAIPSGRMDMPGFRDGGKDHNNRSNSRERRGPDPSANRRRRSRSRERDRGAERRRKRSKSRSRSRSRSRDRSGAKPSRRDSRDKRDTSERKSRIDSSPEKSSQDSSGRSRREQEPSPAPTSANTTTEEWPGAKLTGIPNDASYREIKEFIRVEVMGGSDGVVRLYEEGIAYLKLQSPQEFPRVYRSNGRKLRGSFVSIEGITMETWTQEYKLNKSRIERDIDREKEERDREHEREKDRESRRADRDHRSDRHHNNPHASSSSSSSSHHRSSRFSNASHHSSCIAIRGLAPTITRQELATRYLQDTPCLDMVLIAAPTPTNRHSVTAFIQFDSAPTAQNIIDLIARSPLGTTLVVESCDSEDLQKAKARTSGGAAIGGGGGGQGASGQTGGGFGNSSRGGSGSMNQDAKSIFELDLGLDDETTTVIMKGVPPNITERDVFDFFSDIGLAPMNCKIFSDGDGQCSGNVICEFADNNKAKRATTKDGMLFGRGQISVSLLPSRNTRRNNPGAGVLGGANLQPLGGGSDFGSSGQQQNPFGGSGRNQNPRPGLLGAGPHTRAPGEPPISRFSNPSSSPNIFEQALQQQSGPGSGVRAPSGVGGGRASSRGHSGERMSRFSSVNDNRNDFRNQNGLVRGRGRGRGGGGGSAPAGHHLKNKQGEFVSNDDLGIFNKTGCVIGLENIPYKASMDDILGYLEETLKIRIASNMIIRRFDEHQKPTGDARVAFNTEFEAKLACDRLKGTYMWKRPITATHDRELLPPIDPPYPPAFPSRDFSKWRVKKAKDITEQS